MVVSLGVPIFRVFTVGKNFGSSALNESVFKVVNIN